MGLCTEKQTEGGSMTKVIIELEFDNHKNDYKVTDAEVINYLQELINNDCLTYIKEKA